MSSKRRSFKNKHLDTLFGPFVKSLISRYPANPFVQSSHLIFCFQGVLTKYFIFGAETYARSVARTMGSFDA